MLRIVSKGRGIDETEEAHWRPEWARRGRTQLKQVFDALRELTAPPDPPRRPIGFVIPDEKSGANKALKKMRVKRSQRAAHDV